MMKNPLSPCAVPCFLLAMSTTVACTDSGAGGALPDAGSAHLADGGVSNTNPEAGSDGGDFGTNACGKTGGVGHLAISSTGSNATLVYRLHPGADSDVALGSVVVAGSGVSIGSTDFVVGDGKIAFLSGDALYVGPVPTTPAPPAGFKIETVKRPIADVSSLVFLGGEYPNVFAVSTANTIYSIDVGGQIGTALGAATLPAECTLVDFAKKPGAGATTFFLLANCSTGETNRFFAVSTSANSGGPVSETSVSGSYATTKPLVGIGGVFGYTPTEIWSGEFKVRALRECGPQGPNAFSILRVTD